jgi:hypothetical protein
MRFDLSEHQGKSKSASICTRQSFLVCVPLSEAPHSPIKELLTGLIWTRHYPSGRSRPRDLVAVFLNSAHSPSVWSARPEVSATIEHEISALDRCGEHAQCAQV